ncbi:LCP family protein [Aeribacillus alveayuensis]|uniref:LCP family protein required for cell wall assembly n=1 Tax=Aeribacillus alveayuensis TaxID=279215 RepID=A0ABT9VMC3_9BACI|nr:LCP family protein required for cell wall assembly [Bacillus alveayuensis]
MNRTTLKKKKKRKKLRTIGCLFLVLLLFAGGYGAYLTYKVANASFQSQEELNRGSKSELRTKPIDPAKDHFSVLFIGVDARPGEKNSRSDALILATFNKDDRSIKMVSIPRDSRVKIPDHGKNKINHAHSYGGKDLTVETVEDLFDIPVDYYVELNFNAFIDIVDALGGVEVNSEREFTEQDSQGRKDAIHIKEGIQTLNGEEALAYVRMRKKDPLGDIGRGQRQQEVIKAIIEKSSSFAAITKYDDIIDTIGKNLTTNFSIGNILALQKYSGSINSIESLSLNGYNKTINGVYYYELEQESIEEISDELKQHLDI